MINEFYVYAFFTSAFILYLDKLDKLALATTLFFAPLSTEQEEIKRAMIASKVYENSLFKPILPSFS